jgi:hypothetical protein
MLYGALNDKGVACARALKDGGNHNTTHVAIIISVAAAAATANCCTIFMNWECLGCHLRNLEQVGVIEPLKKSDYFCVLGLASSKGSALRT